MTNSFLTRFKTPTLVYPIILALFGLIFLSLSSLPEAYTATGDKYFFLKKQSLWLLISLISMKIISYIKINTIKKYTHLLYLSSCLLLLVILIPGLGQKALGAKRWLNFGYFSIQPSEMVKISCILFFSKLFSQDKTRKISHFLVYLTPPLALILLEPSLSNAILIFSTVCVLFFVSHGNLQHLASVILVAAALSTALIFLSPYRFRRLSVLLHPTEQSTDQTYHTNQILLAISSGRLTGKGFANSNQKYNFIPKVSTDSIFAVIAEETGFIGGMIIIVFYLLIINYLLKLSCASTDVYQTLIIVGIAWLIGFQSLVNLAAAVSLIPITGVPLPFVSYGGSSLFVLFSGLGLVQGIEKHLLVYSSNDHKTANSQHRHHRQPPHSRH